MKQTTTNQKLQEKAKLLVSQMTLEEKASLCSGMNFWQTKGVERLGLPSFMLTDGPHGLRKQSGNADHLGLNDSEATTCFPLAAATACSFDVTLLRRMGEAMGEECLAEEVGVILGPAANIKRSPLCGRNFEYFSEDPLLTGEISAALIEGIQSKNVGTSMKHYLANNQEKARVSSNSVVDERALREIYLAGFEIAVKKAQPWTIMCSYNKINDIYASDNKRMMTDILRGEWGFEGAVITDWGAMNDRVEAVKAGLDLEMPGPCDGNDKRLVQAIQEKKLDEKLVDLCAVRMTEIALKCAENVKKNYDKEVHNQLARQIARESAVLLRNSGALPLRQGVRLAVVGDFAKKPRYQGAGSSKINPHKITSLCDALDSRNVAYTYAVGFNAEGDPVESLVKEAVQTVKEADVAVIMLGLPDSYESEGFDRTHMNLPESQNQLMEALAQTGKPLIAVLSTGSVVRMPWREKIDSILLMYLAGQNGGSALADLLFGEENPSGKLAETWPLELEDTPCHGFFGNGGNIEYRESIYVGYRYYDKVQKQVAYPFGHGLSYTEFTYSDLELSAAEKKDKEDLTVTLTVKNTGSHTGKEVVQLYVAAPVTGIFRPVRELRGFTKIALEPGESKTISFVLDNRAFAYYDTYTASWKVESGEYMVQVGTSGREIRLEQRISVCGISPVNLRQNEIPAYYNPPQNWPIPKAQFETLLGRPVPPERSLRPFSVNSTLSEIENCMIGRFFVKQVKQNIFKQFVGSGEGNQEFTIILEAMLADMPLRQLAMMSGGALNDKVLGGLVEMMNGHYIRGLKKMKG